MVGEQLTENRAGAPPHPARFSSSILDVLSDLVPSGVTVLDPYAGIGGIHAIAHAQTWGIELESEWTYMHPRNIVGNALALPFRDYSFDYAVTSCTYGNRMADHHDAKERCKTCKGEGQQSGVLAGGSGTNNLITGLCSKCEGKGYRSYKRLTYKHSLGRNLHPDNSGQMQWGAKYRAHHEASWDEVARVTTGRFILNVSNHIRKGVEQPVVEWHMAHLLTTGYWHLEKDIEVRTPRMKMGANSELRVDCEHVLVFGRTVKMWAPRQK